MEAKSCLALRHNLYLSLNPFVTVINFAKKPIKRYSHFAGFMNLYFLIFSIVSYHLRCAQGANCHGRQPNSLLLAQSNATIISAAKSAPTAPTSSAIIPFRELTLSISSTAQLIRSEVSASSPQRLILT